ncbi:hypothetical protein [Oceanithermus sp.]
MKNRYVFQTLGLLLVLAACGMQPPPNQTLELDGTFGSGGVAVAADAGAAGSGDAAYAIVVDADGILLAGHGCAAADPTCWISASNSWVAAAWRFTPEGASDPGFAASGVFQDADAAGGGQANIIFDALGRPGGFLLAGGGKNASGDLDAVLWALAEDGEPDPTTFASGRVVVSDLVSAGYHDFVHAVSKDAGGYWMAGGVGSSASDYTMAVWRLQADGTPDTNFDGDGVFNDPAHSMEYVSDLAILPGGAPLAVGEGYGARQPLVWKLRPEGGFDTTFAGGRVELPTPEGSGAALALALDGAKVLVAGCASIAGVPHLALWRLTRDGTPDPEFGSNGLRVLEGTSPANYHDGLVDLAVDEQGRYWLVGGVTSDAGDLDMAVWRLLPSGELDPHFCGGGPCTFDNAAGGYGDDWGTALVLTQNAVYVGGWSWDGTSRDAVVWKLGLVDTSR